MSDTIGIKKRKSESNWFMRFLVNIGYYSSVAVNIDSISNIYVGGENKAPVFWLRLFRDSGVLIYRGEKPEVLKHGFKKVRFVDADDCTDEELEMYASTSK